MFTRRASLPRRLCSRYPASSIALIAGYVLVTVSFPPFVVGRTSFAHASRRCCLARLWSWLPGAQSLRAKHCQEGRIQNRGKGGRSAGAAREEACHYATAPRALGEPACIAARGSPSSRAPKGFVLHVRRTRNVPHSAPTQGLRQGWLPAGIAGRRRAAWPVPTRWLGSSGCRFNFAPARRAPGGR